MIIYLLLVALIGFLIYCRMYLPAAAGAILLALSIRTFPAQDISVIGWGAGALVLAASLALNIPQLRRFLFVKPLFLLLRRTLPHISKTEREALEAGTVWWDGDLFSGRPDWDKLFAMPISKLTSEEQHFLDTSVEELCLMLDDYRIVAGLHDLPPEIWRFIKEKRFWGMIIPKEYGGLGFSALAHSQVIAKIASRSVTAAVTVMVPNSLGPAELLLHYGTDAQKMKYLPRLAAGEDIPCLALTGPEAGSDAASIPDTGIVCRGVFGGKDTIGLRLNWEKRYITLGPVATLLGLAFRVRDPDHLLGRDVDRGITLALIHTDTPGIAIGHRHDPLGVPFQNGPNCGKDVFIPMDWVVGGASGIGRGWQMIMECLAAGRAVSMPALSTGVGKFTVRAIGAYARVRRQFGISIGRFGGIEELLARMAGSMYILDAARVLTCGALDHGQRPSVISAVLKYYSTEQMRKVVNDGMDVLGGSGICLGPRNLLGRIYQAAPIGITVEGANILTRFMIIFGQGAIRCHPFILKEMQAMTHPDARQGLADFDGLLRRHTAFAFRNAMRTFVFGISGAYSAKAPHTPSRRYCQTTARLTAAFALATDFVLITLGGGLKRSERISARLADILIHLYLTSAMLKMFEERQSPADELPLLRWGCESSFHAIQESFAELFNNLPSRAAAWLLRLLVFPLGRRFPQPGDGLSRQLAGMMMEPSTLRDRLSSGIFIPKDPLDPLGRLEDALNKVTAAEPVELQLRDAVRNGHLPAETGDAMLDAGLRAGIITGAEAEQVRRANAARREVIRVDDFPQL